MPEESSIAENDAGMSEEFDVPKLGALPNYCQKTISKTNNPFRKTLDFFVHLKRKLSAQSDVIYHHEDTRILSTTVFLVIFIGLLILLTYYILR